MLYLVIIKGIKRKVAVLAGILCIVAVLSFCFVQSTQPQILPKESARKPIEQLFKGEGFYGAVEVFEDPFHRYLLVDGILQTKMLIDFDLFFERGSFLRAGNNIELLPYLHPEGKSALFIGLGAGNQPTFFKNNYDWEIDAIEIDPIIAELAKKYFGFEGDVIIEDGRTYLNRTDKIYDFIITDVFAGEQLPEHLFSVEAFERVFKALDEFGVAEYTFIGDLNGDALKSLLFTARQVFPYANVYPGRGGAMGVHSIILRKVPIEILIYNSDWFRLGLKQPEPFEISEEEILKATLLTDAKNPINKIRLEEARRWRQISNKLFNPSIR